MKQHQKQTQFFHVLGCRWLPSDAFSAACRVYLVLPPTKLPDVIVACGKLVQPNIMLKIHQHTGMYVYVYVFLYVCNYMPLKACMHGWIDGWTDG